MERQQVDREFKAQAVRLCEQGDVSIAQVAVMRLTNCNSALSLSSPTRCG